jgi:hypothetical protein
MNYFKTALLVSLILCPAMTTHAAESKPSSQQPQWEKVLAAAKQEGEVRLWGDQEITHPDIVAAFSREYPYIKVVTVTGRVGDLMPRIIEEPGSTWPICIAAGWVAGPFTILCARAFSSRSNRL